jgi:hypothetical protein
MQKWLIDYLEMQQTVNREIQVSFDLNQIINQDEPLINFKESMKAIDSQAWAAHTFRIILESINKDSLR